jgi:cell division protein FtsN
MPRNEEGEFELVVGNKQLLAIVFIMMVLFGLVFSMGYWVGQRSAPEAAPASLASRQAAGGAGTQARPAPSSPAAAEGGGGAAAEAGQAKTAPTVALPVGGSSAEQLKSPATAAAKPPVPAETKPPASKAISPPPVAGEQAAASEPGPGQTFLQVAAVKRTEAELIVDVLKKKGFSALIAPVPNETLFRVLVGPLKDSATMAKTKTDLEQAGFRSFVRKY